MVLTTCVSQTLSNSVRFTLLIAHFNFDWKERSWNLVFVVGMLTGGYIASTALKSSENIDISQDTIDVLHSYGLESPKNEIIPIELFNWESLLTIKGFVLIIIGGFLIGFGTRYAGGCTSGHAISGLSNWQLPSLIAVIGFFIGGLITVHFFFPLIFM